MVYAPKNSYPFDLHDLLCASLKTEREKKKKYFPLRKYAIKA
ncbi:hypothetical protein HanRHA438_Chr10g0450181 [Helianthus annuus]|nr:hypothetical protein HanHA300_Chr10g0360371 [Helianthus annuus]KAJ0529770.1 hypothetical protein HanHA89_Chr10g0381821 [Helianthus annuus]KAJ0696641.1 hypothetical protein HanLR1_Chr10g0359541 [Helianthus annuus]KAJ0743560.1 hypothetical protein HanPI659440_Chr10g0377271 [Helianthus annuus]KAJ0879330.1 hypothetical protein HanRHA438_Chr10g0450181 [Helianthus annuus]